MKRYDPQKECYFEFRAPASVSSKELESFLRKIVEPKALFDFPLVAFIRVRRGEPYQQYGLPFTIQDERLKCAPLYDPVRIYSHNSDRGEVVLRPLSGLLLALCSEEKVTTSLGFLKYPKVIRDKKRHILAESPYGDDWGFRGRISPPDPRIVDLMKPFRDANYLDDLFDEESEREFDAFIQDSQDLS